MTWTPLQSSDFTTAVPRNPAPPVTAMRFSLI